MKRMVLVFFLIGTLLSPGFALNIKIPSMEITTLLSGVDGALVTQTLTEMDLLIEGGYKFGGKIVIGFDGFIGAVGSSSIGQALPPLTFKSVSLLVRDIFGIPLHFSYFIGTSDYLCYGDDFPRLFGTSFIEPVYRATYIPSGMIYTKYYKGLHRVDGNGVKLEYQSPDQPFGFALYVYEDHNFVTSRAVIEPTLLPVINLNMLFYTTGIYSSDMRFLINTETFKAEIFAGGTVSSKDWTGYARAGALLYLGLGAVDFLLVAGLPQLDFVSTFSLDLFYLFFESRLNLGPISLIPSVFARPARYLQKINIDEMGRIDFNLNLSVFNPRKDPISFGAEGNFATWDLLYSLTPTYQLRILPYIALSTPGVFWEIKVSMLLLDSATPLTLESFLSSIQGIISIKAEF